MKKNHIKTNISELNNFVTQIKYMIFKHFRFFLYNMYYIWNIEHNLFNLRSFHFDNKKQYIYIYIYKYIFFGDENLFPKQKTPTKSIWKIYMIHACQCPKTNSKSDGVRCIAWNMTSSQNKSSKTILNKLLHR